MQSPLVTVIIPTFNRLNWIIEVTAKVAKLGCAIYEVPISYYGRTYEQGKKFGVKDRLAAFWLVFDQSVLRLALVFSANSPNRKSSRGRFK